MISHRIIDNTGMFELKQSVIDSFYQIIPLIYPISYWRHAISIKNIVTSTILQLQRLPWAMGMCFSLQSNNINESIKYITFFIINIYCKMMLTLLYYICHA